MANTHGPAGFDAVIVGAGFSGLYALHRLRTLGFTARVFEAGADIGGTWFWNRYPGARCDVESLEYSYSFSKELEEEWEWSERYSTQAEILRYLNHVADRFDLRRDIRCNSRVTSASFDETASRWTLEIEGGVTVTARFCVMATGCLSAAKSPEVRGLDTFQGSWYHTGHWPHEPVDFTGKTVGVIGTGSSGIQSIPVIASQAEHVYVFQRTPGFSVPARNAPLSRETVREWLDHREENRAAARQAVFGMLAAAREPSALEVSPEERDRAYEARWTRGGLGFATTFADLMINRGSNDTAADFVRRKIRDIVRDPATAAALVPEGYPIAAKRLCVDTGYYETFNRPNVTLVDARTEPVEEITPAGLRTARTAYALDVLVFATGFDAMTGALSKIDIRGRNGQSLREKWAGGPRTYLGIMIAGFPNLFTVTGPGSPSVMSNMIVSIEQHVDWIAQCLAHLREGGHASIEAAAAAEDGWVAHVNEVANYTLFPLANSWYMGANVPGKPRLFMPYIGGVGTYRQICDGVVAKGYEGFLLG
jgi:cyclohexanone monooxygenase